MTESATGTTGTIPDRAARPGDTDRVGPEDQVEYLDLGDHEVTDTGRELVARTGEVEIFRYVYRPEMPAVESRKPYLHPMRTPAGDVVTGYRPHDHRWHKGLQMTVSHLSGQNFWGGGSYVREAEGYVDLPNLGTMRHEEWLAPGRERLTWHTQAGEHWVDETRALTACEFEADSWTLRCTMTITNVRGEPLVVGSPTTNGRPMAGYCGLFWRGPRSFTEGEIIAEGGRGGPEMMGERARWLAYIGHHDGVDHSSTLLFRADPPTATGGIPSGARPGVPADPPKWFVRNVPFPAVNPSLAFDEEVVLPPSGTWVLRYRVTVADGAWDRDRLEAYVRDHP